MQSAAGGTSQRLKPAVAMVRSLSRKPPPAPDMVPALLIVVMSSSPNSRPCRACLSPAIPLSPALDGAAAPTLLPRRIIQMRQDRETHPKFLTPETTGYAAAGASLDLKTARPRHAPPCHRRNSTSAPPRSFQLGQKSGALSIGKR